MTHQQYTRISLLGQGSYGKVFLALDTQSGTHVTLKQTRYNNLEHERLILTYIRMQGPIQGLPYLLDAIISFDPLEHDQVNDAYLVLKYIEGQTIDKIPDHSLPHSTVVNIITDFCRIMASLHTIGIVHHDLSEKNILLNKDRHIHILDFGNAYFAPYHLPRAFHADVLDMICLIEDWINRLGQGTEESITHPLLLWLHEERERLYGSENRGENAQSFNAKWEQIQNQTLTPSQQKTFPHHEE